VAAHIAQDPEQVLDRARQNLARFESIHRDNGVRYWLERWRNVINQGPEAVMETLTSRTQDATDLRQNSPFPGVLSADERNKILDSFSKYWARSAA